MSAWGKGSTLRSCDALLQRIEQNDTTLIDLTILSIKTFDSEDLQRLASAILANGPDGNLRTINASGHEISPDSLELLGSAIASTGLIASLSIGDQTMSDVGIISLCNGLSKSNNNPLQTLDLSFKDASDGALEAIGKCFFAADGATRNSTTTMLQRLDLSRNERIGDSGIEALCNASKGCNINKLRHLRCLNLSQCEIGPTGAHTLASLLLAAHQEEQVSSSSPDGNTANLELIMNSNPLRSAGCVAIRSLFQPSILSSLSLVDCNIDDEGISALVEAARQGGERCCCSGLVTLDLSRNQITKKGAEILSGVLDTESSNDSALLALRELCLAENDIGSEGVVSLTHVLAQRPPQKEEEKEGAQQQHQQHQQQPSSSGNCTLSVLDLCKTNCDADGAAAALKCALTSLRFFGNRMGSAGFAAMTPLLRGGHPSLVELDIGGNDAKEEAVADLIREIIVVDDSCESTLRTLEIGGNEVGETVVSALEELKIVRPELDVARDKPKTNAHGWDNNM